MLWVVAKKKVDLDVFLRKRLRESIDRTQLLHSQLTTLCLPLTLPSCLTDQNPPVSSQPSPSPISITFPSSSPLLSLPLPPLQDCTFPPSPTRSTTSLLPLRTDPIHPTRPAIPIIPFRSFPTRIRLFKFNHLSSNICKHFFNLSLPNLSQSAPAHQREREGKGNEEDVRLFLVEKKFHNMELHPILSIN